MSEAGSSVDDSFLRKDSSGEDVGWKGALLFRIHSDKRVA